MKFLIAFTLLFSSVSLFAKENVILMEDVETQTRDNATLKGTRWVNEGKERILLIHGFSENTTVFEDLAKNLHRRGYDVYAFNFRGHGNDDQRSLVSGQSPKTETKTGAYSFDRVITQDIPTMIDSIYDGKPITVLGHSLGGAAARFFMSGVRDYGDGLKLTKDPRKLAKYTSKVKTLINLASPTSFQKTDIRYKLWTKLPESWTNLALNPLMRKYLGEYLFSGLINMENISDSERLFEKGFSLIPLDLISDVKRWSGKIFSSRSGLQYEGLKIAPHINFYQVVGGSDNLVPLDEVLREHQEHKIISKSQIVVMKDFGHVDIAYDQKSANILGPIVEEVSRKNTLENLKKSKKLKIIETNLKALSCSKLF